MSSNLLFKQLSERHTGVEITNLCWNSKFDLLALSNARGEIILQRFLLWKKAWEYACPFENTTVSSICWSPNGECLFVAYSNHSAHFLELENGKFVHEFKYFPSEIVSVKWLDVAGSEISSDFHIFKDLIGELPPLEKVSSSKSDKNGSSSFIGTFLREGISTNLLILSHCNGSISFYLNGYLHLSTIFLGFERLNMLDFDFSEDFTKFFVCFFDPQTEKTKCSILNSNLFTKQIDEFRRFSSRIGKLMASVQYLDGVMKRILDSWEDLLIDVGDKFTKFAKEKNLRDPNSTVGDELMVVCCFGSASSELQAFLTNDLTEKHLKKLIQTLENNYQNLRRLLFLNLNSALSSIFYQISHLREFGEKIDELSRMRTQNACASASLKAREMYAVVDRNFVQLTNFFNWLQKVLLSITEENVPPSTSNRQASQVQMEFVMNFIEENFVKPYKDDETPLFQLEKVGQYLKNENLSAVFERSASIFDALSIGKTCESFELKKNSSLLQEISCLKLNLDEFLLKIPKILNKFLFIPNCPTIDMIDPQVLLPANLRVVRGFGQFFRCFVVAAPPALGFRVVDVEQNGQILRIFDLQGPYSVIDLSIYSTKLIMFLVEKMMDHSKTYSVIQLDDTCFDVDPTVERRTIRLDYSMSTTFQTIEGAGPYTKLAVCGGRKIGCILYSCRTRLKILEMEPDEETGLSNSFHMECE